MVYVRMHLRVVSSEGKRIKKYICEEVGTGVKVVVKGNGYAPRMEGEVWVCGELKIDRYGKRVLTPISRVECEEKVLKPMKQAFVDYSEMISKKPELLADVDYGWLEEEYLRIARELGKEDTAEEVLREAKRELKKKGVEIW